MKLKPMAMRAIVIGSILFHEVFEISIQQSFFNRGVSIHYFLTDLRQFDKGAESGTHAELLA